MHGENPTQLKNTYPCMQGGIPVTLGTLTPHTCQHVSFILLDAFYPALYQHGYSLFPSTECTLHYLWIKMFAEIYRPFFFFSQDNPVSKLWSKAGGEYSQSDCPNKQPGVYSMALWCHLTTLHYGHMEDDKQESLPTH